MSNNPWPDDKPDKGKGNPHDPGETGNPHDPGETGNPHDDEPTPPPQPEPKR